MKQTLPLLLLLAACAPPRGETLWVQPGAGGEFDDPSQVSSALTFTTIQAAVNAASPGDTVSVPSGTYEETVSMADGVALVGAGQGETILVGRVIFEDLTGASLSRMTIQDTGYVHGGTLYSTSSGVFVNGGEGTVRDVGTQWFRWGLLAYEADLAIIDGVHASGSRYGIVVQDNRDVTVTNSLVTGNVDGGIAVTGNVVGLIAHNTVVGNAFSAASDPGAGGIGVWGNGGEVVANNVVTSNWAGITCSDPCDATFGSNLVWGNATDYSNDASAAAGDLAADPLFAAGSEGDYHLSAGSPCIDAGLTIGAVTTDVDGEVRPQGAGFDLGFDEHSTSEIALVISEVMANARTESTGEFVELYNAGSASVDLAGLVLTDFDAQDVLEAFGGGSTLLAPGAYAVVVDPEYPGTYGIDSDVVLVTTGDTTLGNGLTTADEVALYEADGAAVIATFSFPADPGDGISMEAVDLATGDAAGNWRASQCSSGSSPGAAHCFPPSGDPADLILTEVLANATEEATGEYVEIYNPTTTDIDLGGLMIRDSGGSTDTLEGFAGGSTLLPGGRHALLVDPDYAYQYVLPAGVVLVTTGDATIGNGLSNASDSVWLLASDGSTVIDSYTSPSDPGDGISREKIDYAAGDTPSNWVDTDSACAFGRTPGRLNAAAGGICDPIVITEVMANADDEDTGEFVELYNAGTDPVDLAGLVLSDGDQDDVLCAYDGTTVLDPGARALVLDPEYADDYSIPAGTVLVTVGDTTLGNALSVSDQLTLYQPDGVHLVDAFLYPSNPGNDVSVERIAWTGGLDSADSWGASTCASGSSPGSANCLGAEDAAPEISEFAGSIVITEVMANPLTESTGEFVELYNAGSTDVDLLDFVIWDGDALDTIAGFSDPLDTVLPSGSYALILDQGYAGDYPSIPAGTLLLCPDDATLGSGLAVDDPFDLYEANAVSWIDGYGFPFDPGNGISVEKLDIAAGDTEDNWAASSCPAGSSPGEAGCP